ncbi:MAG: hypothetical protein AAF533_18075 [Acidobacteriota bacterium]
MIENPRRGLLLPVLHLELRGDGECGLQLATWVEGLPWKYRFLEAPSTGYTQAVEVQAKEQGAVVCYFRSASGDHGWVSTDIVSRDGLPMKHGFSYLYAPDGGRSLRSHRQTYP